MLLFLRRSPFLSLLRSFRGGLAFYSACAFLLSACGSAALSPRFPVADEAQVANVESRVAARTRHDLPPVAAGVTASGELYLVDLATGEARWQVSVESPAAAPIIAGQAVVIHSAQGITAYSITSGDILFSVEDEAMFLSGAAGEGDLVAISLTTGGGLGARSRYLVARGSSILYIQDTEQTLGAPALAGGVLFLPWSTQNLSAIDAESGEELARVQTTEGRLGWAGLGEDHVFYGQDSLYAFASDAAPLAPDVEAIPGDATFLRDPYNGGVGAASAAHKIRMDWRPQLSAAEVSLVEDRLYATFFGVIFGLHPDGRLEFAITHEDDIVGGAVSAQGNYVVADEAGRLAGYGRDGSLRWQLTTDFQPTSVDIRLGGFEPPNAGRGNAPDLLAGLTQVIDGGDTRVLPARRFALSRLPAIEGSVPHLVRLCVEATPVSLREEACAALGNVTQGADAIHEVLQAGLSSADPLPIADLAPAAARLLSGSELSALTAYINRPHTSVATLASLFEALLQREPEVLLLTSVSEPIVQFLELNHADAEDTDRADTLALAAQILLLAERPAALAAAANAAEDAGDEDSTESTLERSERLDQLRVWATNPLAAEPGRRALSLALQAEIDSRTAEAAALEAQAAEAAAAAESAGEAIEAND